MFTRFVVRVALLFGLSQSACWALEPPGVYTNPANKIGATVAYGIAETLMRRGFPPNDPRILATVNAVGARVGPLAAAAGTGANWLGMISRLTPWATAGVLVYQGVTWYMDVQGKVYLAPPGTTTSAPVYSNGVVSGQLCWGVNSDCFGSPQEVLAFMFSTTKAQYPQASFGVPQLVSNSPTQWTGTYNYSIPELYLNNFSGTKTIVSHLANATCSQGSGYSGSGATPYGCVSAQLANSPYAGSAVVGTTMQQAYDALSPAAKTAAISPELAVEIANRLYKDAASQPDFPGVPFSATSPVTVADVAPYAAEHPNDWPPTSAIVEAVPTTGTTAVALPTTNPNQVTSPSTATKVDLGIDPGTSAPTPEETPTELFKPIKDLLVPWTTWRTPSHSSQCPTWQATPSIAGHAFAIDLSYHCVMGDQFRSVIYAAAFACWVLIAAFIVLSA